MKISKKIEVLFNKLLNIRMQGILVTSLLDKRTWIFAWAGTQPGRIPYFPTLDTHTYTHTYTLPTEVREADEVFPEAFIPLNIQESANRHVTSIVVTPRLDDLKNRKSEKQKEKKNERGLSIATFICLCNKIRIKNRLSSYASQIRENRRRETV